MAYLRGDLRCVGVIAVVGVGVGVNVGWALIQLSFLQVVSSEWPSFWWPTPGEPLVDGRRVGLLCADSLGPIPSVAR